MKSFHGQRPLLTSESLNFSTTEFRDHWTRTETATGRTDLFYWIDCWLNDQKLKFIHFTLPLDFSFTHLLPGFFPEFSILAHFRLTSAGTTLFFWTTVSWTSSAGPSVNSINNPLVCALPILFHRHLSECFDQFFMVSSALFLFFIASPPVGCMMIMHTRKPLFLSASSSSLTHFLISFSWTYHYFETCSAEPYECTRAHFILSFLPSPTHLIFACFCHFLLSFSSKNQLLLVWMQNTENTSFSLEFRQILTEISGNPMGILVTHDCRARCSADDSVQ